MNKTCALTGHRALPEGFDKNKLYDTLEEKIREGYDEFLCGMAVGFDLVALDCLVALRRAYPIRIVACIPFDGQERSFSEEDKRIYRELLTWCDEKRVLLPAYRNGCYLARNRYMVDRADHLLAYCVKDKGGAAYTVQYAKKKGLSVTVLD